MNQEKNPIQQNSKGELINFWTFSNFFNFIHYSTQLNEYISLYK